MLMCLCLTACFLNNSEPPKGYFEPLPSSTPFVSSTIQIELDVFSGFPNPTWSLSNVETEQLQVMLSELSSSLEQTFPDPLGYRGILIYEVRNKNEVVGWRIWNGFIVKQTNDGNTYYFDEDRKVEHWLLQTGKPHITPDLYSTIEAEILP